MRLILDLCSSTVELVQEHMLIASLGNVVLLGSQVHVLVSAGVFGGTEMI